MKTEIHISNDKYGHHGNGKMIDLDNDKEFWDWWNSLSTEQKEQEIGR